MLRYWLYKNFFFKLSLNYFFMFLLSCRPTNVSETVSLQDFPLFSTDCESFCQVFTSSSSLTAWNCKWKLWHHDCQQRLLHKIFPSFVDWIIILHSSHSRFAPSRLVRLYVKSLARALSFTYYLELYFDAALDFHSANLHYN